MRQYSINLGRLHYSWNQFGTITSSTKVLGYSDQVTCPLSNKGNYVDPTNWSYNVSRVVWHYGTKETLNSSGGLIAGLYGVINTVNPEVRSNKDVAYNLALNRLNGKVRGGLDLSIALAEAGTTRRMLRDTFKVINLARRLKPPGGFGSSRDVANGYLQFQYGWKPLMSDVFDAANESIRIVVNKLERISAQARIPEGRKYKYKYASFGSSNDVPVDREVTEGSFSGCKIGVSLEIPTDVFRLDRWTSVNPVGIAWELVPYSFVVDWFFDVSSYLRNIETGLLMGGRFRSGYVSEIWRSHVKEEIDLWVSPTTAFNQKHRYTKVNGERLTINFTRTKLSGYPFPRKPTLKVDLGGWQMASAAALLRQLLPDKSQPQSPRRRRGPTVFR